MEKKTIAQALNIDNYIPAQLVILANKLTTSASKIFRKQFGIGTLEWRILAMIAYKPNQPVAQLSKLTGFDKAAVSRGLNALYEKKFVVFDANKADPRRKTWNLNKAGIKLYNQMAKSAVTREDKLTDGLTDEDKAEYIRLTLKMIANSEQL